MDAFSINILQTLYPSQLRNNGYKDNEREIIENISTKYI